jgi:hypothetical protein
VGNTLIWVFVLFLFLNKKTLKTKTNPFLLWCECVSERMSQKVMQTLVLVAKVRECWLYCLGQKQSCATCMTLSPY